MGVSHQQLFNFIFGKGKIFLTPQQGAVSVVEWCQPMPLLRQAGEKMGHLGQLLYHFGRVGQIMQTAQIKPGIGGWKIHDQQISNVKMTPIADSRPLGGLLGQFDGRLRDIVGMDHSSGPGCCYRKAANAAAQIQNGLCPGGP